MKFKNFESLGKNEYFQKVYKGRNTKADKFLVLYVLEKSSDLNRFGISVSKKVGNSVVRHRLTRIVREAFRNNAHKLKKGYDIVAVIREPLKGKNYSEAEYSLKKLLKKHELLV